MLVGSDEHDGPLLPRDVVGEPVALVQLGRDAQAEDAYHLVHGSGRT